MRRKPDCSKIVELPLSMVAMDHLEPIMYRANFRSNLHTGEKGLRKVLNTILLSLSLSLCLSLLFLLISFFSLHINVGKGGMAHYLLEELVGSAPPLPLFSPYFYFLSLTVHMCRW